MDIELDGDLRRWRSAIRKFAQEDLIPHEVDAEMNGGELADPVSQRHRERALELGLSAMDVPKAHGGLELSATAQVVAWEQLGQVTNALSWCFSEPQRWMFDACTPEQIDRWILPLVDGKRHECYAITEAESGSDTTVLQTTAALDGDQYIVNGEKWYVTSGNVADYFILEAQLPAGLHAGEHVLLFIDIDAPGVEVVRTPLFSHTYAAQHPTFRFANVSVPVDQRIGQEGDGMTWTRSWFRRERLMIAARCCGAAARLIEEATAFAKNRTVQDEPLAEKQLIQAMLADSVAELWAARLMTYDAARAQDDGLDAKALHARCSVAKLYASEMANRVANRAVQIFGGRGYMRENVAERYYRELRVDLIWEGTSEIQRLIIARALLKRGLQGM